MESWIDMLKPFQMIYTQVRERADSVAKGKCGKDGKDGNLGRNGNDGNAAAAGKSWRFAGGLALALLALLACAWSAQADTIILKSGRKLEVRILAEDEYSIRVTEDGTSTLKFSPSEIQQIIRSAGAATPAVTPPPSPTSPPPPPLSTAATPAATPPPSPSAGPSMTPPGLGFPAKPNATIVANPPQSAPGVPAAANAPGAAIVPGAARVPGAANAPGAAAAPGAGAMPAVLDSLKEPKVPAGADGILWGCAEKDPPERKPTGTSQFVPGKNGDTLHVGDEVRTFEGKARLTLRGDVSLRLPARTHVVLRALSADAAQITVEVKNGSIWSQMMAPKAGLRDFKVVTPDLTAGVRGTIFRTGVEITGGSRVGVLEGTVEVIATKTGQSAMTPGGKSVRVDPEGRLGAMELLGREDKDEWEEWQKFADEEIAKLSGFGMGVGAPVIQGIMQDTANHNAQWESMMNEGNRNTLMVKYGNEIQKYAEAFYKFTNDTGHISDDKTEGWKPLLDNTGSWANWSGPYLDFKDVPPLDPWKNPVTYKIVWNRSGKNIHGKVFSWGPNKQDNDGRIDDVVALAKFFEIPAVAANPAYQQAPPTPTGAAAPGGPGAGAPGGPNGPNGPNGQNGQGGAAAPAGNPAPAAQPPAR